MPRRNAPSRRSPRPDARPALRERVRRRGSARSTRTRRWSAQDDPSVAAGAARPPALALDVEHPSRSTRAAATPSTTNLRSLTSGITTTAKTLTLTARRAELPLSFQNDTKRAGIHVRVHLESPKLIFPDGPDVAARVADRPLHRSRFRVEARASGTFTMTVTLESADGSLELGPPTRVTIRSAVFSGIGIAAHGRRAPVPRRLVGEPLPPHAPRAPARLDARERAANTPVDDARAPRPIERGGRDGHAALARHRAAAASRSSPTRSGARRLADTYNLANSTPNIVYELLLGGVLSATLVPLFVEHLERRDDRRDLGRLHGRDDGARRPHRDRDAVRAAHRPALLARHDGRRAHRPAARDDGPHAVVPAADGLLRLHRARDRDAQRAPPLRRGRVRAGAQQRHRDRRAPRVRAA